MLGCCRSPSTTLGEAAELEVGALPADEPLGGTSPRPGGAARSSTSSRSGSCRRPSSSRGSTRSSTPTCCERSRARGHEVAYHAWRHEQWARPDARPSRPRTWRAAWPPSSGSASRSPGCGRPAARSARAALDVLREAGLRYCSPAGAGAGEEDGIALLPFQWRHVDASLHAAAADRGARADQRLRRAGRARQTFVASLDAEIDELAQRGGYLAIVLHPFMLGWLGREHLAALLDRVAGVARATMGSGSRPAPRSPSTCSPIPSASGTAPCSTPTSWT